MAEMLIRQSEKRNMATLNDEDEDIAPQQRPARVPEPVVRGQTRRGPGEGDTAGPSRPQVIRRASATGS